MAFPVIQLQPKRKAKKTTGHKFSEVLFDYDLFCYDIGWAAHQKNEEGEETILPFSWVKDVIDTRIYEICNRLDCHSYRGYLSGKTNFRDAIATRDVYKGNRKSEKPRWYKAIRYFLQTMHKAQVIEGIEADDALSIDITSDPNAICVSRDKDLRQVPGWHYSYPVGNQQERDPELVDELGYLTFSNSKISGAGLKFFYAQTIMGDPVDNYKGLKGKGPAFAYKLLHDAESDLDCYQRVLASYQEKYAEDAAEELLEQARLAWMVREFDEEGNPVMWVPPREEI